MGRVTHTPSLTNGPPIRPPSHVGACRADGWLCGLFDEGSWVESQAGWARSVITGRARLGGIAVGVIAPETATVEKRVPADPGLTSSAEQVVMQAGQVWYPDSAAKTAAAMEEFARERLPLMVLANWRGFSGGQADLFGGVLQAGSLIVEQLRQYPMPVSIYIPPKCELRGGAWVVLDAQINPERIQVFADPSARGGVLEPEGAVEIKFREREQIALMHKIDPVIAALRDAPNAGSEEAALREREEALRQPYLNVALAFADMHDKPARMLAKGVLDAVVPWEDARRFFATRLRARLAEDRVVEAMRAALDAQDANQPQEMVHEAARRQVRRLFRATQAGETFLSPTSKFLSQLCPNRRKHTVTPVKCQGAIERTHQL